MLAALASCVVTTALVAITATSFAGAASAAQRATCPGDGEAPPPGSGGPIFTDNAVAVFAGGDYRVDGGAAESEGLLVVHGDASVDRSGGGTFNIGTVGVGSGVTPEPNSDMFVVGGNVTVAAGTVVSVGASVNGAPGGGNVRVGGTASGSIDTNGGRLSSSLGSSADAGFADLPALLTNTSRAVAAEPVTGSVARSGSVLTFTGDNTASAQVFRLSSAELTGATELRFVAIPADASIAITVTDSGDVDIAPTYFSINGVRVDDFAAPDNGFGRAAGALLWNLPSSTSFVLGGSSQFLGSVLMPSSAGTFDVTASTNGRLYVGGTIHMHGVGNEHHNYPWRPPFQCLAGSFAISKAVHGPKAGDVPPGTRFTVRYAWLDGTDELSVPANGTSIDGPDLPHGTVVTFTEVQLPSIPGVEWGTPVITVDGRPTHRLTVGAGTARVAISNTARPEKPGPPTKPPTTPPTTPPTKPPTKPPTGSPRPPTGSSGPGGVVVPGVSPGGGTGGLADTGAAIGPPVLVGVVLLLCGIALLVAARPRRRH